MCAILEEMKVRDLSIDYLNQFFKQIAYYFTVTFNGISLQFDRIGGDDKR